MKVDRKDAEHAVALARAIKAHADVLYPKKPRAQPAKAGGGTVSHASEGGERQLTPQGLYSKGAEAARALPQAKGSPQQMAAMLAKAGVKPEEMKWSGVNDRLASGQPVTRDDLASQFEEGLPDVREYTHRRYPFPPPPGITHPEPPRYEKYTIPGGEDYRETLLHLPPGEPQRVTVPEVAKAALEHAEAQFTRYGKVYADPMEMEDIRYAMRGDGADPTVYHRHGFWRTAMENLGLNPYSELQGTPDEPYYEKDAPNDYRTGHWPGISNVLAHLRLKDRKGQRGENLLHLEELQSDWAQAARREGFREDDGVRPFFGGFREGDEGVPHGPYVGNTQHWTDLALKHLLTEAAHRGYDKVIWTPGDHQADRYDLSKHIGSLSALPLLSGKIALTGYEPRDERFADDDTDPREVFNHETTPEDLHKVVGQELADKIMGQIKFPGGMKTKYAATNLQSGLRGVLFDTPEEAEDDLRRYPPLGYQLEVRPHEFMEHPKAAYLNGVDLKLGGEGMRGYYDNILPKRLLALAREHDPKAFLSQQYLDPDGMGDKAHKYATKPFPALTITPRMRESIQNNGFKAYADGGDVERQLTPLGLYSKAAEAARALPQAKGTPQQMAAMLAKAGVKPEEMQHAGYEEEFGGRPSVTREEIASHFQNSLPDIQHKVYGGNRNSAYGYDTEDEWNEALGRAWSAQDRNWDDDEPSDDEGADDYDDLNNHYAQWQEQGPKYESYRMPGGKNYREVVLHLPDEIGSTPEVLRHLRTTLTTNEWNHLLANISTPEDLEAARKFNSHVYEATKGVAPEDLLDAMAKVRAKSNTPTPEYAKKPFRSSHWVEKNVIAHLRMSDRESRPEPPPFDMDEMASIRDRLIPLAQAHKDAGNAPIGWRELLQKAAKEGVLNHDEVSNYAQYRGLVPRMQPDLQKILHLDELQSDWAQEGRHKGFYDPKAPYELIDPTTNEVVSKHATPEEGRAAARAQENDRFLDLAHAHEHNRVAPGPYVGNTSSWVDFGLKHALMEAAKGGYDKLVWTPGEEQAKRYDLSQHIGSITHTYDEYQKAHRVAVYAQNGRHLFNRDNMTPDDLERHFGKEIAQKIIDGEGRDVDGMRPFPSRTLEGLDLKTGGEGMKAFYDNIIPKRLAALVKQHDPEAKIGFHDVPIPDDEGPWRGPVQTRQLPGVEITPRMRESVLRGQPAFAEGGMALDQARADLGEMRGPERKENLQAAIRRLGGLRTKNARGEDAEGASDLAHVLDTRAFQLANNKTGLTPDALREALAEQGWFGGDEGSLNELADMLGRDVASGQVFHPDSDAPERRARREALADETTRAGIGGGDAPEMAARRLALHRVSRDMDAAITDRLRAAHDRLGAQGEALSRFTRGGEVKPSFSLQQALHIVRKRGI